MTPPLSRRFSNASFLITHPLCFFAVYLLTVFILTTLVLQMTNVNPLSAFTQIFLGSLSSVSKFGHVIKAWIPLTLCALGLIFTFRINLWNIGVEGQMIMGGICAMMVLRLEPHGLNANIVLVQSFLAAMAGGAFWAFLSGFLKTKGGVNEIFSGLGLNFVAQGMILWLIFGPWKRPGVASMSGTERLDFSLWLSTIPGTAISPAGLGITFFFIIFTFGVLRYTNFGLSLKAIGLNPTASVLYGIKPIQYMTLAMVFGGGLAGLAGCFQVTGVYHQLIPSISSNYGYLALLVVMLANYDIRLTPVISFFFACLNVGSIQLPMVLNVDSSLSGVIQGFLVLTFLALNSLKKSIVANSKEIQP